MRNNTNYNKLITTTTTTTIINHEITGPISVAVYVDEEDLAEVLQKLALLMTCFPSFKENITVSLVSPLPAKNRASDVPPTIADWKACDVERFESADVSSTNYAIIDNYPNNLLRNVARRACNTEFVFVIDVDMLPSENLRQVRFDDRLSGECGQQSALGKFDFIRGFPICRISSSSPRSEDCSRRTIISKRPSSRLIFALIFRFLPTGRFPTFSGGCLFFGGAGSSTSAILGFIGKFHCWSFSGFAGLCEGGSATSDPASSQRRLFGSTPSTSDASYELLAALELIRNESNSFRSAGASGAPTSTTPSPTSTTPSPTSTTPSPTIFSPTTASLTGASTELIWLRPSIFSSSDQRLLTGMKLSSGSSRRASEERATASWPELDVEAVAAAGSSELFSSVSAAVEGLRDLTHMKRSSSSFPTHAPMVWNMRK
ncbi:unnamed protein product [Nesidiocoris tenuis]|uniref:Beta-1,4-glucuronyltransferase 1 n=1 Tax=Nesidiocoris tenuis TaxID=355587 RepID=A0A6H5FWT4_9HEMI|nr:unnamed protein product [Nesidiocoris tenuis]